MQQAHPNQLKRDIVEAIKQVSHQLGNTPSVCRKCYVHPAILESYLANSMPTVLKNLRTPKHSRTVLHPEETAMIHLLKQHLTQPNPKSSS